MAGIDYIGEAGVEAALARWRSRWAPYERSFRSPGHPQRSALLVIDVQDYFADPASHAHLPALVHLIPRIRRLIGAFEAHGRPVLFTRHVVAPGDDAGQMAHWWGDVLTEDRPQAAIAAAVAPADDAAIVRKNQYDAFVGSDLERRVSDLGVQTLVLCGVMTHLCCETTARSAFVRGLFVQLVADATASIDEELHVAALQILAHGVATIRGCDEVLSWLDGRGDHGLLPRDEGEDLLPSSVDAVVVGAGPAGMAAAVQLTREGLSVVLLEGHHPGGLLRQAHLVENHLGAGWLSGPDLIRRMLHQAASSGVVPRHAGVDEVVARPDGRFSVHTADRGTVTARAVILATGTRPRPAGIPGELEASGRQVFHGVAELREDWARRPPGTVVVVGGGDAALDQGLQLLRRGWQCQVWIRGEAPRALALLRRRVEAAGLPQRRRTEVIGVTVDDDALSLRWRSGADEGTLRADRLLVAVGRDPCWPPVLDLRQGAKTAAPLDHLALTQVPGLILVGDVKRGRHRQTAIATGDGIEAAMAVAAHLRQEDQG